MNRSILSLLSFLATAFASPIISSTEGPQTTCTDLGEATGSLPSDSTSFCSSLLQIQPSTITTQVTVTQAATQTLTSPVLTTITDIVSIPLPTTSTSTITEIVTTMTIVDVSLTVTDVDPVTVFSTTTSTSTITTGSSSTQYTFLPGSPPPQIREASIYEENFEGDEEDYDDVDECPPPKPLETSSTLPSRTLSTRPTSQVTPTATSVSPWTTGVTIATTPSAVTTSTNTSAPTTLPTQPATFPLMTTTLVPSSVLFSACSCLRIPTPTVTITNTQLFTLVETVTVPGQTSSIVHTFPTTVLGSTVLETATTTSTTTSTVSVTSVLTATTIPITTLPVTATVTTTVSAVPAIQTVYPCANPVPLFGPTYGDYSSTSSLALQNSIFYLNTPQGGSATACCNTCFFGVQNCIQAYFYSYQGCVVSRATDLSSGTGQAVSGVCPAGVLGGLTYGPDRNPAFRSTGNIAGPCGQSYSNF